MHRLRPLLVLAMTTALLGAPSIASAASNTLTAAHVSPTSGSVATVFTFTVTYDGRFPATGITVAVGGRLLPMTRVGGTPESGTWSGSGTLPAGTWAPLFTATVTRGATAVLTGPTVIVASAGASPSATSPPSGGGGGSVPDDGQIVPTDPGGWPTPDAVPDGGSGGASPAPGSASQGPTATDAPAAAPDPVPGSEPGDGDGVATPDESAGSGASGAPSGAGSNAGSSGSGSSGGSSSDGGDGPGAAPADRSREPQPTGDGWWIAPTADEREDEEDEDGAAADELSGDGLLGTIVLASLSAVAAIALIGTAMLMAVRRRSDRETERAAEAARTEAVLHERMLRRARTRLDDDDPIVASIETDDGER